ncbi:polysaccharide deacetylase family protein [Paenibacillus sp. GSMTC-2017]|uniref:polysaccharide deacetylase family protein n=1 Tax=Paenibacillus sp. GSMTC-2017 TaxID=2794350 RepID=UPI0018D6D292|nr:polysaccharide deacetylase family protein [Paenibacillus sp. GSMTC-2017]MBH5317699.1 polysaccharide deacetylase family protein [Paenibacillus sp. GSMTC-2017]
MTLRKWIIAFITSLALAVTVVAGFNYVVDPFGVFGDKVLKWHSYNMVNNPRVAKISYLDQNHEKYNSYIIGGSKSGSISPELLNKYYGDDASFYSMLMYGGDFHDYEKTLIYIMDEYKPKNIVLHMSLQEISHFNEKATDFKQSLHAKVSGESKIKFYVDYLKLNPSYGYSKLEGYFKKAIDPFEYSQFIPETGVYNKVKRDAEKVDVLEDYMLANKAAFAPFGKLEAVALDRNVEALKRMKEYAEANGATFRLITGATSDQELLSYDMDSLKQYWTKLANVTDFWDFSGYSTISSDPRYFYDTMHYRNSVGKMMLGYIFQDSDVYVPNGFGHLTTSKNVSKRAEVAFTRPVVKASEKKEIPILVYHHIDDDPYEPNSLITPPAKFKSDMEAVKAAGFNAVLISDLIDYVDGKKELPDNPVAITFDDGYLSNYEYAYPVLKELDMNATISIIGWSVGRNEHRLPGKQFYPHFTWDQAREMEKSGVIDIQNHTFDMHETNPDDPNVRNGVLSKQEETAGEYSKNFITDVDKMAGQIEQFIGGEVTIFTYPFGYYSHQSEQMLKDLGYRSTLTVKTGISVIEKGNPESLFALKRINGGPEVPSEKLVKQLQGK